MVAPDLAPVAGRPSDFGEQLSWGTEKDHFESTVRELLAAPDIDVNVADNQETHHLITQMVNGSHLQGGASSTAGVWQAIQEAKLEGREPVFNHANVTAPVSELLESVAKVQALLIAARAQSGKPIPAAKHTSTRAI
ncbi:hypothetical protein CGLO_16335 [Colletotrichum gloeosporioides Cg-14]|uniref:Uncharacterized protein n=1 Tax=Colletotrichum gloeosporioides (strain Cg-14) TaxID=1237896 RepID=T0JWB5_COLGC|nr:hypothetical protein CGLO_16335 [Colletotrichum gloeosporioides Cg-14]